MRLPFFKSKPTEAAPASRRRAKAGAESAPPLDDDAVALARTRARRRLVGALVLLAVGVIGFPLLFETQPRPLPMETPIAAPNRELAPAQPPAPRPVRAAVPPPADAGQEVAAPASAAAESVVAPVALKPVGPASAPAPTPASAPAARSSAAAAAAAPASRPATVPAAAASAAGRFVVQVGAYTDAAMLRDARAKVEKLGLKTYTQVLDADGAKPRTRVRVGPFATREEADAAAAKLKRAGLPANILTL